MSFGRLERSAEHRPLSDINVTPLVDVMLVLVVIFILTAPLLASSIHLDLPKSDAAQAQANSAPLTLVINPAGQTFLNDRAIDADELSRELARIAAERPETELQLRADQNVPYGRVVQVMGLAQKAGLNRIGFVADANKPAAPRAR